MGETKRKNKCIRVLGSIIMGLAFLCLGFFAGFGGKIEEFVKGADEPTIGGTTSSYENAMIYVDSGATTNITGGSVGSMESGNSVYVADGGTLNVTGGAVSGNIYNGGTLNYTAGTLNSVTLASGKYITFKGNPSSTISITLNSPSVGTNIGYLDGITSVTLSRLSVTNLPANTELRIEGGYIKIRYVNRTVTITASPSGYGSVSGSSITIPHGSSVSVSGSTLSYGSTSITATPASQTAQYTYSFDGWYVGNTQITSSRTITANTTITARFTRTTRTYTVTITRNYTSYGTVSTSSVTNVPYGTVLSTSSNRLNVNGTTVTATPATSTAQYSYSFSNWTNGTETVTGNLTVTANFSRSTRSYTITIAVSPSGYGSVSRTRVTVVYGARITTSGSTLTIGSADITATPATSTSQYTYSFSSWSNASGIVTGERTITANFTRTTRTYTVTIHEYNGSYGTVSPTTINVPYGTKIYRGSSTTQLYVGETLVTATPNSSTAQYSYSVSSWREDSSSGTTITTTGFTLEGDKDIYVRFTKNTRSYTITIAVSPSGYGSVSRTSITAYYGTSITTSGNTLSIGSTDITATPATSTSQYTYSFSSWSNASGTVTGARTITANFTRTNRTYTVTIASNNTNYGTVSKTSVTADYGARITTSGSTLTIGSTSITATAKKANASGYYQFSRWNTPSTTVTSNITITASFTRYDSSLVVFETDQANLRTGKYDILNLSHESIYVRDGDTYIIDGNKIEIGDIQVVASGRNDYVMTSQFYRWRNTSTPSVTSGTITGDNNVFHAYSGGWQLTPIKVSLTVRNHINSDAYSIVTEMEDGSTTTVANEQTVEWDVYFGSTIRFGESYVQDTPTMLIGFWVYDWGAGHDALYVSSIDTSDFNFRLRVFINGVYVDPTDIGNIELPLEEDVNVLIEIMR